MKPSVLRIFIWRKINSAYIQTKDYFDNHDEIVQQRWADLKGFGINGDNFINKGEHDINENWQKVYF